MKRSRVGILIFGLVVISAVLVLATAPSWGSSSSVNYYASEDTTYIHDLSVNITGYNNDVNFTIDTDSDINWTNVTGSFLVAYSSVSSWIWIDGVDFVINATDDYETGFFVIPIQATNTTDSEFTGTNFEFVVNATNDVPDFDLNSSYSTHMPASGNTSLNISLVGSDQEGHYPLVYNVSFDDCVLSDWSTRTDHVDCDLQYNMTWVSNTTSTLELYNLTYNEVGDYNLTICTHDNPSDYTLPLYRDSNYDNNQSVCYETNLSLLSSLSINATDCDGSNWTEGDTLSCTINITTVNADDTVSVSMTGSFVNDAGAVHNDSWFYSPKDEVASNYFISIPISVVLDKEEVGNWSINISATDGFSGEGVRPVEEQISIFVNYTESTVGLDTISNLTGVDAVYANTNFQVSVFDEDLRIWDDSVYKESFNFSSNATDWVDISSSNTGDSEYNYRNATVSIDHDWALNNLGNGTYAVQICVSDSASSPNTDCEVFLVQIENDTAPEWDAGLASTVNLLLTEDESFYYDLNLNVSDAESDTITFYYNDTSDDLCSLDGINFDSGGVISFTPTDCDVGYHLVKITASDGKLGTIKNFNFTVLNVNDDPSFAVFPSSVSTNESLYTEVNMQVDDFDYTIPDNQKSFYNEDLTVSLTIENLTEVVTPISFSFTSLGRAAETELFRASFTPDQDNVGNYTVTVNVTDASGVSVVDSFALNISAVNDAPVLVEISNISTTTMSSLYLDVNATDEEDSPTLPENGVLNYSLENLTVGGDFLTINLTTGVINITMNDSLAGFYEYNLSVNDTEGAVDYQIFSLTVYGSPNITSPGDSYVYNWTENSSTGDLEFEVFYDVNNTNLTYQFYVDRIVYANATDFYYTNLSDSLRDSINFTWVDNENLTWNFTPDYEDESYSDFKNFTLLVYNSNFPELNDSVNWKVNITHTNEPISFNGTIPDKGPATYGTPIVVDLSEYFSDADYDDAFIDQRVDLDIVTADGYTNNIETASSIDGWTLTLESNVAVTEVISIFAEEYNESNVSIGNASSNEFEVEFTTPQTTPSSSSRSRTVVKHFSLKLIMPEDVILHDENYIEVPFSVQNTGTTVLSGIKLSSSVLFNNAFTDDVSVVLQDETIDSLKVGQVENYTLRVNANTQRSGKYKVTVFANVTSPKFSDFGDFFITLEKTNESEAEQILIFTEQLLSDNPECLELTEVFNRAQEAFDSGDVYTALILADEVTIACEDAINANEQIRYDFGDFVESNLYVISFVTIVIFLTGLIIYIIKRVRFNKYKEDYNV